MNVIKVTGNNRKAVLDFLNEYMIGSHKPKNNYGLVVNKDNCYIELKSDYFTTHLTYSGPTVTVKQARVLYKPKETKAEKIQRSRAMMYKLKYEQLREELSSVNMLNESQSIQIETLSNSLVDVSKKAENRLGIIKRNQRDNASKNEVISKLNLELDEANRIICNVSKQLNTTQNLYMKEREKTVRLTELCENNEKEVWHLKREQTSLNAKVIQSELEYEDLLSERNSLKEKIKSYKVAFYVSCAVIILTPILLKWIG